MSTPERPEVFVKDGKIRCPNSECRRIFPVELRDRPQAAACPQCGQEFTIITPENERHHPALAERSEKLLPKVKNLLTSSVMLTRSGQERQPKIALEVPAKSQLATGEIVDGKVRCPQCGTSFPVTPAEYHELGECSKCHCQFIIGADST